MPTRQRLKDDHEGRIVRLETGLQQVSATVEKLAGVVHEQSAEIRQQGDNVERELKALAVAVEKAGAPRKTDWHLVLQVVAVAMAIGALVFIPLNMRLDWVTEQARDHHNEDIAANDKLRAQLQRETALINEKYDREIQNLGERLVGRLNEYDRDRLERDRADQAELRQWRTKGMGLNNQTRGKKQ